MTAAGVAAVVVETVAAVLLLGGLTITTVSAVGIVRFRDPLRALHAAGLASGLGVAAILMASIGTGDPATIARAALIGLFVGLTSPVAEYVVAHATQIDEGPHEGERHTGDPWHE